MTIKDIFTYLRHRQEINYYYDYCCRKGNCFDEEAGWKTKLYYWLRSDSFDYGGGE